jgi:hypothetical protein
MEHALQVLAAHCVLKQSSDIVAQASYSHLPSKDRKQQQHILTPAAAKAVPAQRHAHHCSICGAVRHTHTNTLTCMRMHIHIQTQARAHTYTRTNIQAHTLTHTHAHAHTHAHTHVHAYTCAHTHSHAHMHIHTRCARDGLCQLFSIASDAPILVENKFPCTIVFNECVVFEF